MPCLPTRCDIAQIYLKWQTVLKAFAVFHSNVQIKNVKKKKKKLKTSLGFKRRGEMQITVDSIFTSAANWNRKRV